MLKYRKSVYIMVSIIMMLLILPSTPEAADVPPIASASFKIETAELDAIWAEVIEYLKTGQVVEANLKLEELNLEKIALGFKNLPNHTSVVIQHAAALRQQGSSADGVLKLLEAAQKLSPDMAAVYFRLARIRLMSDLTDLYNVGRALWRGLWCKYTNVYTLMAYLNNGLAFVLLSGIITASVFILFSFIYYYRAVFYQLKELSPVPLPLFGATLLGWILVIIVTLVFGVFWGIGFLALALLMLAQVDRATKRGLQLILILGCCLAGLLVVVSATFTILKDDYFYALQDVAHGHYSPRTVRALQQRLQEAPSDPYALFGLAYIAQHTGHTDLAIETYNAIADQYPDRAAVQNNLGNLYQLQFRQLNAQKRDADEWYRAAERAYQAAVQYAPKRFEPHYSLGQLLMIEFSQSGDADKHLVAARKADEVRFTMYSDYVEYGVVTVDMSISTLAFLKNVFDRRSLQSGSGLARELWASGSRFRNPWFFSLASFVLLLLSGFVSAPARTGQHGVQYCQMCGDPFIVKRKKGKEQDNFCTQCTYIFKKKTVVKPEKRAQKVQQIQLRQKTRNLIAKVGSLLFPGAGQVYFGYISRGLLLMFGASLAVTIVLLKLVVHIGIAARAGAGGGMLMFVIVGGLLLGLYLFNLYDIFTLSPKNQ